MAEQEITEEWVVRMVQYMKEQKLDIASCIMATAEGGYILLETGSMFQIKPVRFPFKMPTHEFNGKKGMGDYTLSPGFLSRTTSIYGDAGYVNNPYKRYSEEMRNKNIREAAMLFANPGRKLYPFERLLTRLIKLFNKLWRRWF